MNKYYVSNEQFNSNKRIFEAYFTEAEAKPNAFRKVIDFLLKLLSTIVCVITCAKARALAKASSIALCLIGLIGIIGAIENGTISIGVGLLFALALLCIEFFTFKKSVKDQSR